VAGFRDGPARDIRGFAQGGWRFAWGRRGTGGRGGAGRQAGHLLGARIAQTWIGSGACCADRPAWRSAPAAIALGATAARLARRRKPGRVVPPDGPRVAGRLGGIVPVRRPARPHAHAALGASGARPALLRRRFTSEPAPEVQAARETAIPRIAERGPARATTSVSGPLNRGGQETGYIKMRESREPRTVRSSGRERAASLGTTARPRSASRCISSTSMLTPPPPPHDRTTTQPSRGPEDRARRAGSSRTAVGFARSSGLNSC